jgi:tetratricopeptide (TPR) repeat protein
MAIKVPLYRSSLGVTWVAWVSSDEVPGYLYPRWRRCLAHDNPAHQPDLAAALTNLGIRLDTLSRHQQALAFTEEAVGLLRPLAHDNPAHQPNLATTLANLGLRLDTLSRYQEALAAAEEAVGLWRRLALTNPGQYQPIYYRALAWLRRTLQQRGQESASTWLHLGDDNLDRNKPAGTAN